MPLDILVVCGLRREAAMATGIGIVTVAGGGDRTSLENRLAALGERPFGAVLSFGLAAGLDPRLRVGGLLVPSLVRTAEGEHRTDAGLAGRLRDAARDAGITVASAHPIVGIDRPVATAAAKAALGARTGAAAADMESHVAAAYADRRGLPFAILRVVSDAADRAVPPAAIAAMGRCGEIDAGAALGSLARWPGQIPALIATARDGARAFRVLRRVGGLLHRSGGFHLR